jgi:hypothetical protein
MKVVSGVGMRPSTGCRFEEALEYGLRVILAPPWIRRIHRQLGLSVDMLSNLEARVSDLPWYRIVFPADPSYAELYAADDRAIYPEDPWFADAVDWARTSTLPVDETRGDVGPALAAELASRVGEPPFADDWMFPSRLAEWPSLLLGFLDWLALKRHDGEFQVNCLPIKIMARDNAYLMKYVRLGVAIAGLFPETPPKGLGRYADAIEGCLSD